MNQIKFYKIVIVSLFLLNIAVLAFFVLTKPKPPHNGPKENKFEVEAIETLNLSNNQISTFKKLGEEHKEDIDSIKKEQQKLLLSYFEGLTTAPKEINKDDILMQYKKLEGTKMTVTYNHFEEIKSLLSQEQLPHFNGLLRKFIYQIVLEKKKRPHPPKEFE